MLKLWSIAPCDMSKEDMAEQRKAKARARMKARRRKLGSKPQETSLSKTKPWIAEGISPISRATYYRRLKQGETGSCAVLERRETTSCATRRE
jgi:hypothetical protein